MSSATVLKTGLVGYVYRGLRDGGLIALTAGFWMLGSTIYPAMHDGRAEATVTGIEIDCAFNRDLGDVTGLTGAKPDCSTPALAQMGLVDDATFAKITFAAETGETHRSEIRIDDLKRPGLQRGDTVEIAYSRDNPTYVRAVPGVSDYLQGIAVVAGGLLMLAMVWFARRAANYQSDVDAEVAELERAYRARTART
jgi:hypothetical protein